jgi:hypothetical protein
MRNPLNNALPVRGAKGGRLPKFPRRGGATAIAVILAIAALVWKANILPPPAAPTSAEDAAKAAARAMTFTQSPEPNK